MYGAVAALCADTRCNWKDQWKGELETSQSNLGGWQDIVRSWREDGSRCEWFVGVFLVILQGRLSRTCSWKMSQSVPKPTYTHPEIDIYSGHRELLTLKLEKTDCMQIDQTLANQEKQHIAAKKKKRHWQAPTTCITKAEKKHTALPSDRFHYEL